MNSTASTAEISAARGYEALFVPCLCGPWTGHVLRELDLGAGVSFLDVACGTGILARDAQARIGPAGDIAGLDAGAGMIAVAAEMAPDIAWVQGNAESLPFDAGRFDCVASQFGLMFFADPAAALADMLRVLRPGGQCAIAVWNDLSENPVYRDVAALLDTEISAEAGNAVRIPFSLGAAAAVVDMMSRAGFDDVVVKTQTAQARFPGLGTLVEAELRGWLPLFGIALPEDRITAILNIAADRLAHHAGTPEEVTFDTSAHVITAKKPAG